MNTNEARKKALRAYKEREEIGGLYRIINTNTGWQSPITATPNLEGMKNRLAFAKKTNTRFDESLKGAWEAEGPDGFELVEIERLAKKPEMTIAEFREELADLLTLWMENEKA